MKNNRSDFTNCRQIQMTTSRCSKISQSPASIKYGLIVRLKTPTPYFNKVFRLGWWANMWLVELLKSKIIRIFFNFNRNWHEFRFIYRIILLPLLMDTHWILHHWKSYRPTLQRFAWLIRRMLIMIISHIIWEKLSIHQLSNPIKWQ